MPDPRNIFITENERGEIVLADVSTGQRVYAEDFSTDQITELRQLESKKVGVFKNISQMGTTTTNAGVNTFIALRPPS
mgnify:FL=1|jgi:hypothetical protein